MSAAHTPGPWVAGLNDVPYAGLDFECWTVDGPDGGICTVDSSVDEREANARLIAAAPELLEALQELASEVATAGLSLALLDRLDASHFKARAAIAKARGR